MTLLFAIVVVLCVVCTYLQDRAAGAFQRLVLARLNTLEGLQAKTVTTLTALPRPTEPPDPRPVLRDTENALIELRSDQRDAGQRQEGHATRGVRDLTARIEASTAVVLSVTGDLLRAITNASNEVLQAQAALHSDFTTIREEVIRLTNVPAPVAAPKPKMPNFPPGLVEAAAAKGVSPEQLRDMMAEALGV